MSLGSALATAMAGLRANQAALSVVSSNIANAQTPGYISRSINQVEVTTGDIGASVLVTGVNRQLNQYIQSQLRTETAGGAYADQMANVLTQLQSVYGSPGAAGSLETAYHEFHDRPAVAVDDVGKLVVADLRPERGPGDGATAQLDDAGHSNAADQCRAGPQHLGGPGQRRDEPDRDAQHPASGNESDRSDSRDADGPARRGHQPAVAANGHPRLHHRQQPDHRLYDKRRRAGRSPGVPARVQFEGNAERQFAMEQQSRPCRPSAPSPAHSATAPRSI